MTLPNAAASSRESIAAPAIEHRAAVVSYDDELSRFPGVRRVRPGEAAP